MRQKTYLFQSRSFMLASLALVLTCLAGATTFTPVSIASVANSDIQTKLISTFPTGSSVTLGGVPYNLPTGPDNYYDGFGFNGSGKSIMLTTSVSNPTDVYTLMNAYFTSTPAGTPLASITFSGTNGVSESFTLIAGDVIRDFYDSSTFIHTLNNGELGITATNVFSCSDPSNCLGGGGTGNVNTGAPGTYVIDQQDFSLGSVFAGQTLTSITIQDLNNSTTPILLGLTVGQSVSATPEPNYVWFIGGFGIAAILVKKARARL
jgi:hypothetical protein